MNEVIAQDDRYPEWMKAWNAKTAEIDERLIDFYQETSLQTVDAAEEIARQLHEWWERQHQAAEFRAEIERNKQHNAELFRQQLDKRVQQLVDEGRITAEQAAREENGPY